jgi:PD-(D/E)XK endonuclease
VEWTPSQKGAIAETAITAEAVRLGIGVYRPVNEGERCDLIFNFHPQLVRVQCKWARLSGAIIAVCVSTSRLTPAGYLRTTYSEDEIDAVVAYCPELNQSYFLPIAMVAGKSYIHLRLEPSKNQQRSRIHWAQDHLLGAIAQLGERSAGSRKVAGSNPASSTDKAAHNGRLFS